MPQTCGMVLYAAILSVFLFFATLLLNANARARFSWHALILVAITGETDSDAVEETSESPGSDGTGVASAEGMPPAHPSCHFA